MASWYGLRGFHACDHLRNDLDVSRMLHFWQHENIQSGLDSGLQVDHCGEPIAVDSHRGQFVGCFQAGDRVGESLTRQRSL